MEWKANTVVLVLWMVWGIGGTIDRGGGTELPGMSASDWPKTR